jgi:hypothetical protein
VAAVVGAGAAVEPNEVAIAAVVEDLAWAATCVLKPVVGFSGVGVPGTATAAAANVVSAAFVASGVVSCGATAGVVAVAVGVLGVAAFVVAVVSLFGTAVGVAAVSCVCAA